jgi:hypothetical protein
VRKKIFCSVLLFFAFIFVMRMAEASVLNGCDLTATLLNQDPYPATPDDYVKVVFKIEGLQNPNCKAVSFELMPEFPFSLDPNVSP